MELKGSCNAVERSSAISVHLDIVEVKCNVVDEKILKVLKFLCSFNIRKITNASSLALYILKLAFLCGKQTKKASSEEDRLCSKYSM